MCRGLAAELSRAGYCACLQVAREKARVMAKARVRTRALALWHPSSLLRLTNNPPCPCAPPGGGKGKGGKGKGIGKGKGKGKGKG